MDNHHPDQPVVLVAIPADVPDLAADLDHAAESLDYLADTDHGEGSQPARDAAARSSMQKLARAVRAGRPVLPFALVHHQLDVMRAYLTRDAEAADVMRAQGRLETIVEVESHLDALHDALLAIYGEPAPCSGCVRFAAAVAPSIEPIVRYDETGGVWEAFSPEGRWLIVAGTREEALTLGRQALAAENTPEPTAKAPR